MRLPKGGVAAYKERGWAQEGVAMSVNAYPRPGVACLACGAMVLGLSAVRLVSHWAPGPGWLWVEFSNGVVGVALGLWGWSRLQRAKAARPDLSWWQFLHVELIGLGIAVVLLPALAALSAEQRNGLVKSLMDLANLVSLVRGQL
jgi:hypothetical protein